MLVGMLSQDSDKYYFFYVFDGLWGDYAKLRQPRMKLLIFLLYFIVVSLLKSLEKLLQLLNPWLLSAGKVDRFYRQLVYWQSTVLVYWLQKFTYIFLLILCTVKFMIHFRKSFVDSY